MKRLAFLLALIGLPSEPATAQVYPPIIGDVDGDRLINVRDLLALRQALDGWITLPADAQERADVDDDGALSESDFDTLAQPALAGDTAAPFQQDELPRILNVTPPFGLPGSVVKIDGANFGNAPVVRFGATEAILLSGAKKQILCVVPDSAGPLFVTDSQRNKTSAGYPFVLDEDPFPETGPLLAPGEVLVGLPAEVPLPNVQFTVPIAVCVGEEPLGCVGVSVRFDPDHIRAVHIVPTHPEFLTPLPPCIDNAGGLLGSGSIRNALKFDVPKTDVVSLVDVVFECINYRPYLPVISGRVDAVTNPSYPSSAIGDAAPRFAVRSTEPFPAPFQWNVPATMGAPSADDIPQVLSITKTGGSTAMVKITPGGGPVEPYLVLFGTSFVPVINGTPANQHVLLPANTPSGPVTLLGADTGLLSRAAYYVTPETMRPSLVQVIPPNGATVPTAGHFLLLFSEVLDPETVTPSGITLEAWQNGSWQRTPASVALFPYGFTMARVRAAQPLPAGSIVRIRLSPTIRDLAGNSILPSPAPTYGVAAP